MNSFQFAWFAIVGILFVMIVIVFIRVILLNPKTVVRRLLAETTPEIPMAVATGNEADLVTFNGLFVKANQALAQGNTEGLKTGIALLISSLPVAGQHRKSIADAVSNLRCTLGKRERADTKGPWNRDLSGYGVMSWKNDLWDQDDALRTAWPHIKEVNDVLVATGKGWNY